MIISLIAAVAKNNVIGKNNELVWCLPNDMRFFKNTTWALPVIMGRKTYEALNSKALQGRLNIVITANKNWKAADAETVHSLEEAIALAEKEQYKEAMVIGGGQLYSQAIHIADRLYITRVDAEPEGDAYFPAIDTVQWQLKSSAPHPQDVRHAYAYDFQIWERNKN
jgi:dihydrofolate reductase